MPWAYLDLSDFICFELFWERGKYQMSVQVVKALFYCHWHPDTPVSSCLLKQLYIPDKLNYITFCFNNVIVIYLVRFKWYLLFKIHYRAEQLGSGCKSILSNFQQQTGLLLIECVCVFLTYLFTLIQLIFKAVMFNSAFCV